MCLSRGVQGALGTQMREACFDGDVGHGLIGDVPLELGLGGE